MLFCNFYTDILKLSNALFIRICYNVLYQVKNNPYNNCIESKKLQHMLLYNPDTEVHKSAHQTLFLSLEYTDRPVLLSCSSFLTTFPNNRVKQKDSLYFGSCKKLVTTSGPSSHLTSVVAGQPTYCDCTSDMQTCAPGRDVVNCASTTSTSRGGHLPGICCCPISQNNICLYSNYIDNDIGNNGR